MLMRYYPLEFPGSLFLFSSIGLTIVQTTSTNKTIQALSGGRRGIGLLLASKSSARLAASSGTKESI